MIETSVVDPYSFWVGVGTALLFVGAGWAIYTLRYLYG